MTWIFVCSNNLVRSVVAAAICCQLSQEIEVASVGLAESCKDRFDRQGRLRKRRLIAPVTRKFLAEKGLVKAEDTDIRARRLTADDVQKADRLWVMTENHKRDLLRQFPEAEGKVHLLGDSAIKDNPKTKLTEVRLQEWYDQIKSALKVRVAEVSQLP
jgi:protein-tyrosine-phosphatase